MTTAVAKRKPAIPSWAAELGVARIEDYFGPWAYEEQRFAQIVESARGMNLSDHIAHAQTHAEKQAAGEKQAKPVELTPADVVQGQTDQDGICTIMLQGSLMKYVGSLTYGTSTVRARQLLRAAGVDADVRGVLLRIDSPGGTAAGTGDLAEDIANLAAKKPVIAFIEDLCASAAYWVASAASQIIATSNSLVGCIGTYSVVCDYSAAATLQGIKVHVVRAGEMKGAGVPGTEITPAVLADVQRVINSLNQGFLEGVAKGRRMGAEQVASLADGRVWIAKDAKEKGLIDATGSIDHTRAALLTLVDKAGGNRRKKETRMSQENTEGVAAPPTPKPATFAELKSTFPKSDAAWRESCMERNLTLSQAQSAWTEKVEADLTTARADLEKAQTELKTLKDAAALRPGGARPVLADKSAAQHEADDTNTTAVAKFEAKVKEHMDANKKLARDEAFSKVVTENPELHQAYVEEKNASRKGAKK